MSDTISKIFDNLDSWRHLPSYQLERRADIFFAAYLPELLMARFGTALGTQLISMPSLHALRWFSQL
jgi:hypothetical protein